MEGDSLGSGVCICSWNMRFGVLQSRSLGGESQSCGGGVFNPGRRAESDSLG